MPSDYELNSQPLGARLPYYWPRIKSARDRALVDAMPGSFERVVLPANFLLRADPEHTTWLQEQRISPVIDPATNPLFAGGSQLLNGEGTGVRPDYARLAYLYGLPESDPPRTDHWLPADIARDQPLMADILVKAISFQLKWIQPSSSTRRRANVRRLGTRIPRPLVVPPYCGWRRTDDGGRKLLFEFARRACELRGRDYEVWPLIVIQTSWLGRRSRRVMSLLDSYKDMDADGYFLWFSGPAEDKLPRQRLFGMLTAVRDLADTGRPVRNWYGGYFSLLMTKHGLSGFSSGIGHREGHRSHGLGGGGGASTPRYYVPHLRRLVDVAMVDPILQTYPRLRCRCQVCRSTFGLKWGNFRRLASSEVRRSHFLAIRSRELVEASTKTSEELLTPLRQVMVQYQNKLPPSSLQHLPEWVHALAPVPAGLG